MTPNLLIGITALGVGWVALHSKRADTAVAQNQAPTVATDPKDTTTPTAESLANAAATPQGQGFATPDVGDTNPSTSPVVNSHLAGIGVTPAKDMPSSPSAPSCGSSDCEFGGAATPAPTPETAPAPKTSVASFATVSPSTIINAMVYGEGQRVTAKEESAAMETYGPQGGYIW